MKKYYCQFIQNPKNKYLKILKVFKHLDENEEKFILN